MNAADIVGHPILQVDVKDVVDTQSDTSMDDVQDIHFYTFVTQAGRADVILHVEHNGYYAGWLNTPTVVSNPTTETGWE